MRGDRTDRRDNVAFRLMAPVVMLETVGDMDRGGASETSRAIRSIAEMRPDELCRDHPW
jgi:hypothetical protein